MARKLNVDPDALSEARAELAGRLLGLETAGEALAEAQARAAAAAKRL